MTTYTSRRDARRARNQAAILDAAYELVDQHGIDGLVMRDLAKRSDFSMATIYKYFDSKDAIIAALRERGFEVADSIAPPLNPDLTYAQQCYQAAQHYLSFAAEYPTYYQLMFNTGIVTDTYEQMQQHPSYQGLLALTRLGLEQGDLTLPPGHSLESLTLQHWITVHGLAMAKLTMFRQPGDGFDRVANQMLRGYINSFVNHPLPDTPGTD